MKYEKNIKNLARIVKNAKKRVNDSSYQTKTPKADVQFNHIVRAMKRFDVDTNNLGPRETKATSNICQNFDAAVGGFGFGVPYHTLARYEVINCKTGNLVSCEPETFGPDYQVLYSSNGSKRLANIRKHGHKYAYQVADASKSNNEPLSEYKPIDDDTVDAIAECMLLCIEDTIPVEQK